MALVTALALQADRRVIDVIVIGTALAVSDLFELRPANRAPIPLGFAVALVLLRAATLSQFVVIVLAAALVACILRGDATPTTRAFYFAELIAAVFGHESPRGSANSCTPDRA